MLDLADDFLAAKAAGPALYCKQDTHWSGQACILAARKIAAEIRSKPWAADLPKRTFTSEAQGHGDHGRSLAVAEPAGRAERDRCPCALSGTPPARRRRTTGPARSCCSATATTWCSTRATTCRRRAPAWPTNWPWNWEPPIDVLGVRGSGATPSRINLYRRVKADPNYLAGKKLVIWCLSAREFTEGSGWKKVPVLP